MLDSRSFAAVAAALLALAPAAGTAKEAASDLSIAQAQAAASVSAAPDAPVPAADRALIERLFEETGAERELPGPDWAEYLGTLAGSLLERLLSPFRGLGLGDPGWARVLAWALLGVIIGCLLSILVRSILRARHKPARSAGAVVIAAETRAPAGVLSRDAWRAEIRARLARGDRDGALEALWWWFAQSLVRQAIDPSWTSRELLGHAGRADLQPQAAALDRMLYGPVRPRPAEIVALSTRLEAILP